MITILTYLLKVGLCIIVFYAIYKLALSKESFFKLNRIVILTSVILSLALPIYTITITKEVIKEVQTVSPVVHNIIIPLESPPTEPLASIITSTLKISFLSKLYFAIIIIYLLGVLFFLVKQIIGHTQIILLQRGSKREGNIFLTDKTILPFSWFKRIIINKNDYNQNREIILAHEHAHIQSNHFYDLVFINLFTAIQWFNPVAWLLKKELIANHEFSADEYVIKQGINAKQYQLLLIAKATYCNTHIPVVSHLYSGSLAQRVKMMLEKKSKSIKSMKALLMLPFIFCAILAFAETKYVELPSQELSSQAEDLGEISITLKGGTYSLKMSHIVVNDSLSEKIEGMVDNFKEQWGITPSVIIHLNDNMESTKMLQQELKKAKINDVSYTVYASNKSTGTTKKSNTIEIKVLENGNLVINGKTIDSDSHLEAIKQAVSESRERTGIEPRVIISAEPTTEMGLITDVKQELRKSNVNTISYTITKITTDSTKNVIYLRDYSLPSGHFRREDLRPEEQTRHIYRYDDLPPHEQTIPRKVSNTIIIDELNHGEFMGTETPGHNESIHKVLLQDSVTILIYQSKDGKVVISEKIVDNDSVQETIAQIEARIKKEDPRINNLISIYSKDHIKIGDPISMNPVWAEADKRLEARKISKNNNYPPYEFSIDESNFLIEIKVNEENALLLASLQGSYHVKNLEELVSRIELTKKKISKIFQAENLRLKLSVSSNKSLSDAQARANKIQKFLKRKSIEINELNIDYKNQQHSTIKTAHKDINVTTKYTSSKTTSTKQL